MIISPDHPRPLHPGERDADYRYWHDKVDPDATMGETGIKPSDNWIWLHDHGVTEAALPHDENGNIVISLPPDSPPLASRKEKSVKIQIKPVFYRQDTLFDIRPDPRDIPSEHYETKSPEEIVEKIHQKHEKQSRTHVSARRIRKSIEQRFLRLKARQGI